MQNLFTLLPGSFRPGVPLRFDAFLLSGWVAGPESLPAAYNTPITCAAASGRLC